MSSAGEPSSSRRDLGLPNLSAATFVVLAITLSLFQLYISGVRPIGLFYERAFHLALIQVLAFLLFPTKGRAPLIPGRGEPGVRSRIAWTVDAAFMAGSVFAATYLTLNLDAIVNRAGAWSGTDVLAGVVAQRALILFKGHEAPQAGCTTSMSSSWQIRSTRSSISNGLCMMRWAGSAALMSRIRCLLIWLFK